jgi:hypothetical protein
MILDPIFQQMVCRICSSDFTLLQNLRLFRCFQILYTVAPKANLQRMLFNFFPFHFFFTISSQPYLMRISRHLSFYKTSGRRGNTSGRCPAFQNIPYFLYKRVKELQQRPFGHSAKLSGRGPDIGRNCINLEGGRKRPSGQGNLPPGRSTARVQF